MYRLRIDDALEADFPRLHKALGSDWPQLCAAVRRRLLRTKPDPTLFALEQVSDRLPKALTVLRHRPDYLDLQPLAKLEWQRAALWLQPAKPTLPRADALLLCPLLQLVQGPAGVTAVWRVDGEHEGEWAKG